MPVSTDLRAVVGRLSAAIAGGDSYGRTNLTRLREELELIAVDAEREDTHRRGIEQRIAELGEGLERSVECLQRLERRARTGDAR